MQHMFALSNPCTQSVYRAGDGAVLPVGWSVEDATRASQCGWPWWFLACVRQNDGQACVIGPVKPGRTSVGNWHSCTTQYFISDTQGSSGGGEIAPEGK